MRLRFPIRLLESCIIWFLELGENALGFVDSKSESLFPGFPVGMIGHGLKVWGDLIKFNKVFQKKNLINDNKI